MSSPRGLVVGLIVATLAVCTTIVVFTRLKRRVSSPVERRPRLWGESYEAEYAPEENSGMGDCLFNCFSRAAGAMGRPRSVRKLRQDVAGAMDEEKLDTLKQFYAVAKADNDVDMLRDYGWLGGVRSLGDLRKRIASRQYYGDDMALPVLERSTGLNAVVVSRGEVQRRADPTLAQAPWIVLLLENVHYRLMKRGSEVVFSQMPQDVVDAAKSI